MDIAVVTPRQLALSVGTLRAGVTAPAAPASAVYDQPASAAPTSAVYDPPASGEPIYFGSLEFTPHPPALRPAFDSLYEGTDLVIGNLRFHVNKAKCSSTKSQ